MGARVGHLISVGHMRTVMAVLLGLLGVAGCWPAQRVLAASGDHVVLPFACTVQSGKLVVQPSQPRYYRISDRGPARAFTVCAPGKQTDCRVLTAHRFDILCVGGSVAWRDVAAKGTELLGGGARVVRDRLQFQFRGKPAPWRAAKCDAGSWPPQGHPAGLVADAFPARGCVATGRFDKDKPFLTFPAGYAPLAELGGRLLVAGADIRVAAAPPPAKHPRRGTPSVGDNDAAPGPAKDGVAGLSRAIAPVAQAAKSASEKRTALPQPELRPSAPGPEPVKVAAPVPQADPQRVPNPIGVPAPALAQPAVATTTGQEAGVRALAQNWLTIVALAPSERDGLPQSPDVSRGLVVLLIALALMAGMISSAIWIVIRDRRPPFRPLDAYEVILRRDGLDLSQPHAQVCADMCQSAQTLIGQVHGRVGELRGVAPLRRTLLREVRDVERFLASLISTMPEDEEGWRRTRTKLQRVINDMVRLQDIVESAHRSLADGSLVARGLPTDRSEALEVLGANEHASERILKRLVDALRATWHPDHAVDDADRQAREERIKQINVAWDLVCGKRAEA